MPRNAKIIQAVRDAGRPAVKPPPAEKAIHIPLPFDDVMSAVLKVKPEPKPTAKPATKKPSAKKSR
jgi:hypothetical protein